MTYVDDNLISVCIASNGTDTTAITEAWFSCDRVGDSSGVFDRVYAVHCTTCLNYPKFPTLIEYNTFDSNCIKVSDTYPYANPVDRNAYIGESINIGDIAITKVIFPAALKQEKYVSMLLYSGRPAESNWYGSCHSTAYMSNTGYAYNISLNSDSYPDLDTIIQFTSLANGSLTPYCVMNCIHTSNYSNPHTDQISHIGSSDLNGYMSTVSHYAALTSPFNGIIIGSTLIANDYSVRYLGDQVLLEKPDYISSNGYYICLQCQGSISGSEIVYPGRNFSYLVLAGPLSASSLDTTASVAGIRRCCRDYGADEWDEWTDQCSGIIFSSFFNPVDGHLYTCAALSDMSIKCIKLRFSAIENDAVYCDYLLGVGVYTPTYTTLTFGQEVKDPVALRSAVCASSVDNISSCTDASWNIADNTDMAYYTQDPETGGSIIESPSYESLTYTADMSQNRGGFYTTNECINFCEYTDVIHAVDQTCLAQVYSNPDTIVRGVQEPIVLCSCLKIKVSAYDECTGEIVTTTDYVCAHTPELYFTIMSTGMQYCSVEDKALEYVVGGCIDVDWITIPYLVPDSTYINCACRSYVWDTCRDASPYLCDSIVYGVHSAVPGFCYCLECIQQGQTGETVTPFYCITQYTEALTENSTLYCERGVLTLTKAFDEDGVEVNRPYLIRDEHVLGGWKYPDALYIKNRARTEVPDECIIPQRININTYYCCTYFTVPEGSNLCMDSYGCYYIEGDTICLGNDVIVNVMPYGANHNTATYSTCGDNAVRCTLVYCDGQWNKKPTNYDRDYLVEHPAKLYVSYPANGYSTSSPDYAIIDACLDVYVCYDIETMYAESFDSPDEASDINLSEDAEGRQYITYIAQSSTTAWDISSLIHWTPASATVSLCYTVDPEESLNNTIISDGCGHAYLNLDDGMPSTYGLGAVTVTAAKCSSPDTILSKKIYVCIQQGNPELTYHVVFDNLPEGITITDMSPVDLTNLRTGTNVSFRIENTSGRIIESVLANNQVLFDNSGLYTVIIDNDNINITVILVQ